MGGKVDEPIELVQRFGNLLAAGARYVRGGILRRSSPKNQYACSHEPRPSDPLTTMHPDPTARGERVLQPVQESKCLFTRFWNSSVGNAEINELDRLAPAGLRLAFQLKFDNLLRHQQREHGLQTQALPGADLGCKPIGAPGSGENSETSRPVPVNPVNE